MVYTLERSDLIVCKVYLQKLLKNEVVQIYKDRKHIGSRQGIWGRSREEGQLQGFVVSIWGDEKSSHTRE